MCVCVCVYVHAQEWLTLCDPWTVAHRAPLSMELYRQEYLNGLPFTSPWNLPGPGIPALQEDSTD